MDVGKGKKENTKLVFSMVHGHLQKKITFRCRTFQKCIAAHKLILNLEVGLQHSSIAFIHGLLVILSRLLANTLALSILYQLLTKTTVPAFMVFEKKSYALKVSVGKKSFDVVYFDQHVVRHKSVSIHWAEEGTPTQGIPSKGRRDYRS